MYDFNANKLYTFKTFYIPKRMMHKIRIYIQHRIKPGDFLSAVIQNDLKKAVGYADDENIQNIPAYVAFFYNEAPTACYGSPEAFKNWLTPPDLSSHEEITKEEITTRLGK